MRVHQFHAGTAPGDAITNNVLHIQRILRKAGFESEVFAAHVAPALRPAIHELGHYRGARDSLLLVHHTMGYETFEQVLALPDSKILVYHNITPPEFLVGNHEMQWFATLGRIQLARYRDRVLHTFADSGFNAAELEQLGFR